MKVNPAGLTALATGDIENFLLASTPGGIELQEEMGQRDICGITDILPIRCPRPELEKLGFVFGEPCSSEPHEIFVNVAFPEGWSKKATDHSMWSDLLDAKGRKRAGIFYKSAFYDRSAHMKLDSRYHVKTFYYDKNGVERYEDTASTIDRVVDCDDRALFSSENVPYGEWDKQSAERERCAKWLDANLPNWKDATAYWD